MFEIGRQIDKEILRECVLIILTLDKINTDHYVNRQRNKHHSRRS
jgi:hypothetical protein